MKWLKLLDSLAPPYSGRRLSDMLYKEVLRAEEPAGLLKQVAEIYGEYVEEKGPFTDMFGEYSMVNNHLNAAAGQFFTPLNVCDFMDAILMDDLEGEPKRILDPAAGSGRFMLRTAKYYADKTSKLNFVFFNVDIDFRMYVYCSMNAILNGIPSVTIWGDSLACKYNEGIVTIPVDRPSPWTWIDSDKATSLMIQPFSGFVWGSTFTRWATTSTQLRRWLIDCGVRSTLTPTSSSSHSLRWFFSLRIKYAINLHPATNTSIIKITNTINEMRNQPAV